MMFLWCTVGVVLVSHVLMIETCPTNAVNEVFFCLSNLTAGIHEGGKKLGADSYIIKRICRKKEFQTAIDCVEGLFRDCRHKTDLLYLLRKLADPRDIRQAFHVLCANVDLYVESSGCMMEQDQVIQPCFRKTEIKFDHNIVKSASVNQEISTFCGFQTGMRDCIIQPVADACGLDIGKLLYTFMRGVTSPVCNETNGGGNRLQPVVAVLIPIMLLSTKVFT